MSQILKIIACAFIIAVAWIMKISINLLIRMTVKRQDANRRIANVNRNYKTMTAGAKMLIKN